MKNRTISLFSILSLILSIFAFSSAYANTKDDCNQTVKQSGGHCVYFSGVSDSKSDGRFVKYYVPDTNYNLISCMNAETAYVSNPRPGSHTDKFYICNSLDGEQCELVSQDTYTSALNGNKVVTDPQVFEVKLAAAKDKYPACTSSW